MELQLGLTLSTNGAPHFNSHVYEAKEHFASSIFPSKHNNEKKRSFSQLFDNDDYNANCNNIGKVMLPTLSLLPLTPHGYQNYEDHDDHEDNRSNSSTITTKKDEDDVEALVGWPPVNSWRKKVRCDNNNIDDGNDQMVWINVHHHGGHGCSVNSRSESNALYVKVKMEGVGIARKVDLRMHHSLQTLKETLIDMFGKCGQHSNCYELAYQDEEGDWLLADDVPWRSFIQCAQRLKLVKTSG